MNRTKPPRSKRAVPAWLGAALGGVITALLVGALLVVNATVPSASMEPTIRPGQQVLGWRPAYRLAEPARGDIVLLRHPAVTDQLLVKRIIAVGGDTVAIRGGVVLLNGEPLAEAYAIPDPAHNAAPVTVPEGFCYVLGDHRAASGDSSRWSEPFVPYAELVAKVIWIYG